MVRLGNIQNPASKEKGHWPQEDTYSSRVEGRGALPGRKRGVKAGPEARRGDTGLEVSSFG